MVAERGWLPRQDRGAALLWHLLATRQDGARQGSSNAPARCGIARVGPPSGCSRRRTQAAKSLTADGFCPTPLPSHLSPRSQPPVSKHGRVSGQSAPGSTTTPPVALPVIAPAATRTHTRKAPRSTEPSDRSGQPRRI